jgi:hypothetical protein
MHNKVPEDSVTPLGPGTNTTSKTQLKGKKTHHKTKQTTLKPAKNRPETPQSKATRTRQFTRAKSQQGAALVRPMEGTSQTD